MADYFEQSILTYSGLSTETKPTAAAGNNVPNGSRWREVDTGKIFFYNLSDDAWYEVNSRSAIVGTENPDRAVWVTPTNALSVESPTRLVGTNFDGTTKDPNFWTETKTGSGAVTQDGEIQLDTGVTADSTVIYDSIRTARFVVGSALKIQMMMKWVTAGTADNIRRCGAYDDNDGFFVQLDGTTFSIGWRKGGSDTTVDSGSFNGNYGTTFTPLTTQYYKIEIEWGPKGVFFYVNGELLHKNGAGHLTGRLSLPIRVENLNDNGSIVDVAFDCLGAAIMRLGDLTTNSTYYHLSGNAATHVLKYGPGTLHKIMFNNTSGTSVTIYDNTAASGDVIGIITTASGAIGEWSYDVPFNNGLTLVTVGNSLDATIVYE